MSQLIHLKQRIQAVETIKKITNAMRITAMSTHSKMNSQSVFLKRYEHELKRVFSIIESSTSKTTPLEDISAGKQLIIIIGSDKGLCGNFNSALANFVARELTVDENTRVVMIGKKIKELLHTSMHIEPDYFFERFTFNKINAIAHEIFETIEKNNYKSVEVFYTKSKSFFLQKPIRYQLIPTKKITADSSLEAPELYFWQESPEELVLYLYKEFLIFSITQILFDSMYSEQAARFRSMDSATRNAENILDEMKIQYSKLRQAKITKELTELSSHF